MKRLCLITAVFIVIGCAAAPKAARQQNPRIIYRDLTQPVAYKIIQPQPAPQPEKAQPASKGVQPQCFVEFANESYATFNEKGLAGIIDQAKPESLILVVGHSHGHSAVGTLALASKRAETIARHLKGRGYKKVLVMASWGGQVTEFAPNRGVHVYVIEQPDQTKGLPIIIAKEAKSEPAKPSRDFELAASKSHKSRKGL